MLEARTLVRDAEKELLEELEKREPVDLDDLEPRTRREEEVGLTKTEDARPALTPDERRLVLCSVLTPDGPLDELEPQTGIEERVDLDSVVDRTEVARPVLTPDELRLVLRSILTPDDPILALRFLRAVSLFLAISSGLRRRFGVKTGTRRLVRKS
jgi:hypothetical protein